MRRLLIVFCCTVLAACATTKLAPPSMSWDQREHDLQHASVWQLQGRAAVAMGTQGWQAALNWQQSGLYAVVHLLCPFCIGALLLEQQPGGLSLNGAAPSDSVAAQLQDRLGFEMPLDNLRFWLLGVPDPSAPFELARNDQDRAQKLTQLGWSIVYDRYLPFQGDLLPSRMVLSRADVRVRIVVDHWDLTR
jgi:outer membrane lipoprotein LolB